MNFPIRKPVKLGDTLKIVSPQGSIHHAEVDHVFGQYAWCGATHRIHIADDRCGSELRWITSDGTQFILVE